MHILSAHNAPVPKSMSEGVWVLMSVCVRERGWGEAKKEGGTGREERVREGRLVERVKARACSVLCECLCVRACASCRCGVA